MKHLLLLLALALCSVLAAAQQRSVSGTVRDQAGNPLPGVAVMVPGTTNGVVTDIDGRYTIAVDGSPKLSATFIGMVPAEIDLAAGQTDVTMSEDRREVDEVVVVAYGVATKGTYTGSAAQMGSATLEKRQASDVSKALSGVMPGVQTLSSNGQPGVSSSIRIRGVGSINASSDPLIVVDGMPFDGELSSINTTDVENITILKDAASTSLYGARGANGIVMVTTKRGKQGEAKVTLEGRWGGNSRQIENYDVLRSPQEYLETYYAALYNDYVSGGESEDEAHADANADIVPNLGYQVFTLPGGEMLIGRDGKINPKATLGYSDGKYYYTPDNWEDEMFKTQGRQQYDLTVSGGQDKFNYFLSFGYLNDEGLIPNSAYKRVSTRVKVDYQAKKWLKVGVNAAYNHMRSRYPDDQTSTSSSGNAFFVCNSMAPIYPMYVRNADGSIKVENGRTQYDYGDGQSTNFNREFMSMANPMGDLLYDKRVYDMDVFNGNVSAEITPITGLSLSAKYSLFVDNTRLNRLWNSYMGQSSMTGGAATQRHSRLYAFDQQYVGVYSWTVAEDNAFDVTVGYDGYHMRDGYIDGYGANTYNPESYYLGNVTTDFTVDGQEVSYATAGYFARLNYAYAEKYLFNVSYRRDSSSRFSEDNRWGDFWSVSAGWLLNKENFMANASWVDMLKLKASYGEQGNDNIGNDDNSDYAYYAWQDQYDVSGANGMFSDAVLVYKGNPDLTWETSKSWNVGLDFAFLRNKVAGSVEYFGRKSSDMLYYKPVAASNGYTEFPMNVGSMTNSGFEVDVNVNVLNVGSFNWDINANATFLHNEINELHPDLGGKLIDGSRIYEEGESMYRMYLVDWAGVDEKTGDALWYAGTDQATGERLKTNDYQTAQKFKVATDDLLPTVYGGFGTSLEFFGFDASIAFSYQLGGEIFDSGYQYLMHGGDDSGRNWHTDIRKAWTPDNTKTDVPRMDYGNYYINSSSTRFLTSSDYLALNNITFGYTIPADFTKKLFLESVRVYFAADNLALWSKRDGLDPRQSYTSATTSRYTAGRSISGGIKITF